MEEKKLRIDKKVLFVLLAIFGIILLFLFVYFFLVPRFRLSNFSSKVTVPLKADFTYNVGNACYGTFFHCEEVKATESGVVDT